MNLKLGREHRHHIAAVGPDDHDFCKRFSGQMERLGRRRRAECVRMRMNPIIDPMTTKIRLDPEKAGEPFSPSEQTIEPPPRFKPFFIRKCLHGNLLLPFEMSNQNKTRVFSVRSDPTVFESLALFCD